MEMGESIWSYFVVQLMDWLRSLKMNQSIFIFDISKPSTIVIRLFHVIINTSVVG